MPIDFFVCSWERARDAVREQRPCDWWIYDWQATDYYWLFGNQFWWLQPMPAHSPLARRYYEQLTGELNNAVNQWVGSCESRRYPLQDNPKPGLNLSISSRLDQGGIRRSDSAGNGSTGVVKTQLSVPFTGGQRHPRRQRFALLSAVNCSRTRSISAM